MTWLDDQAARVDELSYRVGYEQSILDLLTDIAEWTHDFKTGCVEENDVPPVYYGDRPEPGYCECTVSPCEERQANGYRVTLANTLEQAQGCHAEPDILVTARTVLHLLPHWKAGTRRADLRCEKDEIMAVLG